MRRALLTVLFAAIAVGAIGASTCTHTGPLEKTFAAGSLVIPMDNCYQRRDGASAPGGQDVRCNGSADDGVFRAYGLAYFLLKHNVTVYWAIDGASPKVSPTGIDVTVPAPASGPAAKHFDWAGGFDDFQFPAGQAIKYIGGPFIIDAADRATVLSLLASDPDFARFKSDKAIDIHEAESAFTVPQVRPISGQPPKLAILAVNPQPYHKTSLDVMYKYAVAAGLDDPGCDPSAHNCAGGLGPSCDPAVIQKYLNNTLCGFSGCGSSCSTCTRWVEPAPGSLPASPTASGIQNAKFNPPGVSGKIFDILCDGDFIPQGGTSYADTQLAKGGYKLLWVPHWDTGTVDPQAVPPTTASTALATQLSSIASYVSTGNNLFVECLGIGALEGGAGKKGLPATRFQTTAGMTDTTTAGNPNFTLTAADFHEPQQPNIQVGDFAFPGSAVDGAITTFHPDNGGTASKYVGEQVKRLVYGTAAGVTQSCSKGGTTITCQANETCNTAGTAPVCTACAAGLISWNNKCVQPGPWDVATTSAFVVDGIEHGHVAYLGGHDYSPDVNNSPGQTGQTAGTRIVLNTLFNLGFACADPNTECTTGAPGACSKGTLKCASGGGTRCEPNQQPSPEVCDGIDNDCNGKTDEDGVCNTPECTDGATKPCSGMPDGDPRRNVGACRDGTQTCIGGKWGPCENEKFPSPEVCNGKDDDCKGGPDDGNLCPLGSACTGGLCVPSVCHLEAPCPAGFVCTSGSCVGIPCPTAACATGKVCKSGACVDPCDGVQCGAGSTCSGGLCLAGGCAIAGCQGANELCINGSCTIDPCAGLSCPKATFCRAGDCVRSCAFVECASGQTCGPDGFCAEAAACAAGCPAGQVCTAAGCQADPCTGVSCGAGQVCKAGACIDPPCAHVSCSTGSRCEDGQCVGGVSTSITTPVKPASSSGGCGSSGSGGLASIAAVLAAALLVQRRRRGVLVRVSARSFGVAGALALAAFTSGCSSKGGSAACTAGAIACGDTCAVLATAAQHCGACGHACAEGFACTGGSCAFPTGNPFLAAIDPSTAGANTQAHLTLSGDGFQAGAVVRVTGSGLAREVPLEVASATSATALVDLTGSAVGTAEVRVLNPGHLVSNPRTLSLGQPTSLLGVSPAAARQDGLSVDLHLSGTGFVAGASVTLTTAAGAPIALTSTYVSSTELDVTGLDPAKLAVGTYDLTVSNPGAAASRALKFSVNEGQPQLASITPSCAVVGTFLLGTATGSFAYPTSVVHVSGGAILDSPLDTTCKAGVDALGQCTGGQLRVTADLSTVPGGAYDVRIVNPGSPALSSATIKINVGASCP